MTFEQFAKECREEFPSASEINLTIRARNLQVTIIYDEPSAFENVMTLDGKSHFAGAASAGEKHEG